jgi:hypothetical protein
MHVLAAALAALVPVLALGAEPAGLGPPASSAPDPAAPAPRVALKQRGSWYIGFGLGAGGAARLHTSAGEFSPKALLGRSAQPFAFNFRVGATITPKLLLGFDGGALAFSANRPSETFQQNFYDLGIMYFPWERGLYLRGAAGLSALALETDGPVLRGKDAIGGYNVLGGVGYAFWLLRSFNLTVNVDYQRHFYSHDLVEGSGGLSAWVGFDWY